MATARPGDIERLLEAFQRSKMRGNFLIAGPIAGRTDRYAIKFYEAGKLKSRCTLSYERYRELLCNPAKPGPQGLDLGRICRKKGLREMALEAKPKKFQEWPAGKRLVSMAAIEQIVTAHVGEWRESGRQLSRVHARHIAIYFMREIAGRSLSEIGQFCGGLHHTTVLYAVRKIADWRKSDAALDACLNEMRAEIEQKPEPSSREKPQFLGVASRRRLSVAEADMIAARVVEMLSAAKGAAA